MEIADGFKNERAIVTPYIIREIQASNLITKRMYVTHIGYYPCAKDHYRKRENGAPENILIYCQKGKGYIECNNEIYSLTDNQLFIIPSQQSHAYWADKKNPWGIYWMHFKGEDISLFQTILCKKIEILNEQNSRIHDRLNLFEEIYQNLEMGYSIENLEYISHALHYFLASIKYIPQYREVKNVKIDDIISRCILYMKDNLETKISIKDIADHVGYSGSHLNMLFTKKTSYSPIVYYNQLRIQRACSYLQFSDLKIKEIAFRLCFFDPFHFSKAFMKEMEITPKEYRKRYYLEVKLDRFTSKE